MLHDQTPSSTHQDQQQQHDHHHHHHHHHHHQHHHDHDHEHDDDESIREIHTLTSPLPPPYRRRETTTNNRSSSLSVASTETESFTTMSREFNALVLAGTSLTGGETSVVVDSMNTNNGSSNLERIGEENVSENNALAIVRDDDPIVTPPIRGGRSSITAGGNPNELDVQLVKKEEVESKISAWQNAKISKINNRFKRDEAIINGWENEQVQKSSSWMKKVETKLEAKRAHAMEKMENEIAKARRKAEERRATSEAKRGTKVAGVMEVANLMRAVGRVPAKRSFF